MQGRDEANHQAHGNGRDQRADGFRVETVAVPVFAFWRVVEQIVNRHLAALNQVEVGNQNAEQRADKRPEHVQGVVDKLRGQRKKWADVCNG